MSIREWSKTQKKLNVVPNTMIDRQNNISSPPAPVETRGRNVTVCPANIFCYHSNTLLKLLLDE
jgi:hypothetical protein